MTPVVRAFGAALMAAALVLPPTAAAAKDSKVSMRDNYYAPSFLVIVAGDTVTWRNQGRLSHTVVTYSGAPRSFDSSPGTQAGDCAPLLGTADCIAPGETFAVTFTQPGTYDYYCKAAGHANPSVRPDPDIRNGREQPCGMCGRIVVREKTEPPPPTRAPPPTAQPSATASASASPSPTGTETGEPSPGATGPDGSPIAQQAPGDGAGGRAAMALGAILVLGGAGWLVWRKYIAA